MNVVRQAEQKLVNDGLAVALLFIYFYWGYMCGTRVSKLCIFCRSRVKEYLPIVGLADFNKLSAKLILGADR